ncbi:hypothetical protein LO749_06535 [Paracoccus denitrificans]|uniref:hypothetical protein n=1 Tax=Paracoccus denitrificans TaxID=266 RepID=UPI001E527AA2|nr:hypothetical protein [Paracoccus denitrificans]UFS63844.1 hypothetical protein LO749_06535 [Paracoccus denitrificans]
MADLMAEGMERREAVACARRMMGLDDESLTLPASERRLIRLVLAVAGQWRMGGGGLAVMRPIALDMTAVDVTARWLGIAPDARLFEGLAIVEREALKLMRTGQ